MPHREDIFSEVFAQRENFLTGIEARIKIAFTLIALLVNLLAPTPYTPLSIAIFCFILLLLVIKIPPGLLLLRLAMPLVMATIILVVQTFLFGTTPLFTLSLGGFHLTGYDEGLARGFLIMVRMIAGVSLILFLGMSTPANKLFLAASWFKAPKVFLELALLIYRYVFLLLEEVATMKDAQRVRLGYGNWRRSMKSLGVLGGSLILRAYERAEKVYEAMLVRGYTGQVNYQQKLGRKDYLVLLSSGALLIAFYLAGLIKG